MSADSENRMVQPFTGKAQTDANILRFKVGVLGQDLFNTLRLLCRLRKGLLTY